MIILEYMILAVSLIGIWILWEQRLRVKCLQETQNELIEALQQQFLVVATRDELNNYFEAVKDEIDKKIRNMQVENDKRHLVMHDRFDDIQRNLLSKSEFDKYQKELREQESILQEAQKKIKENRNKSLRIAFGGKDDE